MMENISFTNKADGITAIPDAQLFVFRYVLAFNHFRNEVHVLTNFDSATDASSSEDDDRTECFIREALSGSFQAHPFRAVGVESGSMTDPEFIKIIEKCKQHIARGDVFQIVPSRRYQQEYEGDDFQVYRALRSLNPSPYLFYCDFGGFRVFGSSPEAQIIVKDGEAAIHPIAGTCRRVGNDAVDRANADTLLHNEKENAEHAMLVDLARNDLSRHCKDVHVAHFREVQYFSHVIHLVSKVVGRIPPAVGAIKVMADSFPLGTLSGAPKHRAMQLLDQYEPTNRRTYGGSIGLFGFNGDAVLGIMIRSFFSTQRSLSYQVGMGIVHDSVPEQEVEEGNAKLGALRAAVRRASEL
jgi:anthranilate synthase component 1